MRGYYAYMDIWVPLIGDDSLTCQNEPDNVHDDHAVAIKREGRTVGHVPENISGFVWRFLSLPNTSVRVEILGPRMNRGAGHGLEVPVVYRFLGHRKAVDWLEKKITVEETKLTQRLEKCLKNTLQCVMCNIKYFSSQKCVFNDFYPWTFWFVRYIEVRFYPGTRKTVRYREVSAI